MAEHEAPGTFLSGWSYDALKFVAQILLPALATLYFTLAGIWDLPKAEEIVGTITAVDLFLGLLLKASSSAYQKSDARFDGSLDVVGVDEDGARVKMNMDPDHVFSKDEVTFKVNNEVAQ
jgi:hypothetical protein